LAQPNNNQKAVYRVLDANLNRLREALRVIEEYFRFFIANESVAITLKKLRHSLEEIESGAGTQALLACRDTKNDPFANVNRPEELGRSTPEQVVCGNFKRGQEAARVIEEYLKITPVAHLSEKAKILRFSLYDLEKSTWENIVHE
jgi:thiamine-phosphate pyrophosphorylase